jgi:hypothetical protein
VFDAASFWRANHDNMTVRELYAIVQERTHAQNERNLLIEKANEKALTLPSRTKEQTWQLKGSQHG